MDPRAAATTILAADQWNPEQAGNYLGGAADQYRLGQAVDAYRKGDPTLGAAFLAAGGRDPLMPYVQSDKGQVLNRITGGYDASSPLAQAFIGTEGARAAELTAGAGANEGLERLRDEQARLEEQRQLTEGTVRDENVADAAAARALATLRGDEGDAYRALAEQRRREPTSGAGGGGRAASASYKASDANTIGRWVWQLYGGRYDPATQTFSALTEDTERKAAAVIAEAERLYIEALDAGAPIGHQTAVRLAAERFNVKFPLSGSGMGATTGDPLGLFPEGLPRP